MVFSSAIFLFLFLPAVLAAYYLVPWRPVKNVGLLLASLVFYAWGEPAYVALMVVSMVANWAFGLKVGRGSGRAWLAAAVVANLLVLGFFKYEGFLAGTLNGFLGVEAVPDLELPLPIGISFYTLQALSYLVDVHRGQAAPQRNLLYLGMYIAMFPQLVAGPIVRYTTIEDQIENRRETLRGFSAGVRLFAVGLAKKCLLANTVAQLADSMLAGGGSSIGLVGAWAGLVAYTFQILFDFSGYSDMAIGLGKMFGFEYLRNFNYPYISRSVTEFWRRWHVSLGSFFRDYVYIPLGGNRCGRGRWILNIAAVWALTGLWHGAAWNFVLWGVYYGTLLVLEKAVWGRALEKAPSPVRRLYTVSAFMFGWLIFWIEDFGTFAGYLAAMFGAYGVTGSSTMWELGAWEYWPVFLICLLACTPIAPWVRYQVVRLAGGRIPEGGFAADLPDPKSLSVARQLDTEAWVEDVGGKRGRLWAVRLLAVGVDLACAALLVLSVLSVVMGTFDPFIYFRF